MGETMYLLEDKEIIEKEPLPSDEIESDAKAICEKLDLKLPSKSSLKYYFYNFKLPRISDDSVINDIYKNKERRKGKPPVFFYKYYLTRILQDNDDVLGGLVEGDLPKGFERIQTESPKLAEKYKTSEGKIRKLLLLPFLIAPEINQPLKDSHIMWVPPASSLKEQDFDQIQSTYNSLCIQSIPLFYICIPFTILTSKNTAKLREKLLSKCKFIFIMHTRLKFHGVILAISASDNWKTNYPGEKAKRYNENIPCFFNYIGSEPVDKSANKVFFQNYMVQAANHLLAKSNCTFNGLHKDSDLKFTLCTRLKGVDFEPVAGIKDEIFLENVMDISNFSLSNVTDKEYPKKSIIGLKSQIVILDYYPELSLQMTTSERNENNESEQYEFITNSKKSKYNIIEHKISSFVIQKKGPADIYKIPQEVKKFCLVNSYLLLQLKSNLLKIMTPKSQEYHRELNNVIHSSLKDFVGSNKNPLSYIGHLSTSILAKVPLGFNNDNAIHLEIKKDIKLALGKG